MQINADLVSIQNLNLGAFQKVRIDTLRTDLIHPIISGNKWYKLRFYLADAIEKGCTEIASFGGAYSNHIVATACACKEISLKSIGFIRGDQTTALSQSLQSAASYGMQLEFVSRATYKDKSAIINKYAKDGRYWIPEGGYGLLGAKGAASILADHPIENYNYIIAAIGSGTMMAGLLNASLPHQTVIGISSQKNNSSLESEVRLLVDPQNQHRFRYMGDYHFGGFAKHPPELLKFMANFWHSEKIPTDIVYTGKVFFALSDLLKKDYFKSGDQILVIHSGGLQGNFSLPENSLPY